MAVIEKYGNQLNFLSTFNPSKQSVFAVDKYRCFKGVAPSLGVLAQAYNQDVADSWIEIQLKDLSEYSGCKEKLSIEQLSEIAKVIRVEWGYLKVTELMYFFHKFKAGEYGKFYGAVDGLVITCALQEFIRDRNEYLWKINKEEERKMREEEDARHAEDARMFRNHCIAAGMKPIEYLQFINQHGLTYEEMDEIGWLFKMGYDTETLRREKSQRKPNGVFGAVKRIFSK